MRMWDGFGWVGMVFRGSQRRIINKDGECLDQIGDYQLLTKSCL